MSLSINRNSIYDIIISEKEDNYEISYTKIKNPQDNTSFPQNDFISNEKPATLTSIPNKIQLY